MLFLLRIDFSKFPLSMLLFSIYIPAVEKNLYKKQDLHLHGLVTYQPTSDEVMSVYRLSSRFERFHHSCSFYNLQYVKELFKGQIFLNLCLLYQNIRCCFRCSDKILNFFQNFPRFEAVEEGGIEPPSCSGSLRTHSQA